MTNSAGKLATPQALDSTLFREAMSRIAAAVHLVTTDGPAGRAGATVSAMCSLSDDPAMILVCINQEGRLHEALHENRCYCLSTLAPDDQPVSDIFAGRGDLEMEERFTGLGWLTLETGSPALTTAKLNVDCTVDTIVPAGSHSIFIGKVCGIRLNDPGPSLLYAGRQYQRLDD